jgi:DNA (cytosine-5)-methyltransferase 1
MKYFSMFTGVGGFELGIQQAYEKLFNEMELRRCRQTEGQLETIMPDTSSQSIKRYHTTCIGFSEIDKYASQLLQIKFPNTKNYGDATTIDEKQLPDFDLLVGGFPCQSFSIAGKRKGFADTRGTLFFDIARILAYKKPRNVLLENVKGLLSHDGGQTFQTIVGVLTDLGYFVEWQVLNSKNFGVPQNRERVFIIGHLGGTPRPQVFPIGESNAEYAKGLKQLNNPKFSSNRIYSKEGISPNLRTMQGGNLQPKILAESKIRRLTPTECERLQGFPDGWTEGISDTQRYKTLGNAVTVNVIEAIANKLNF